MITHLPALVQRTTREELDITTGCRDPDSRESHPSFVSNLCTMDFSTQCSAEDEKKSQQDKTEGLLPESSALLCFTNPVQAVLMSPENRCLDLIAWLGQRVSLPLIRLEFLHLAASSVFSGRKD